MNVFHKDGSDPSRPMIFVFGANLAGVHGAGAARAAADHYGAEMGFGTGFMGQSYAIPTKDERIKTMPLSRIAPYVAEFVRFSREVWSLDEALGRADHPLFFVTRVGCGLAGYKDEDIAPMFKDALGCSFAEQWTPYLEY